MKAAGAFGLVLGLCALLAAQDLSPNIILAGKSMPEESSAQATSERLPNILREVRSQMVRVKGGSFIMGCTTEQEKCDPDESPVRSVQVASFEIGRYEVTQELWQAVMGKNPSTFDDCPRCPVETVSWDDIQAFLRKLNEGGAAYRLPSEAEWEYTSRGGQRGRGHQYSGSNDLAEVSWYYENSNNRTQPVGQKKMNELGLFDMSGNVREWVQDCWHDSYVGAPGDGRAWEKGNCVRRVIRGGSWYGKPNYLRSANRFWYTSYFRNNNLGFRLALTPDK
jgi:formylglycine-generating enzyme required for sulfatase activity